MADFHGTPLDVPVNTLFHDYNAFMHFKEWIHFLKRREEKEMLEMVRRGVPHVLKGTVWKRCAGLDSITKTCRDTYWDLSKQISPWENRIARDIHRTFPKHVFFRERDSLG